MKDGEKTYSTSQIAGIVGLHPNTVRKYEECCYKRAEAAKELGLTIDTIRNWEMNGLITVKRKQNAYEVKQLLLEIKEM